MSFDADTLRRALAQHGRVARVVIVSHSGSSPREAGASMLVWEGGQTGTIGGGALELDAARTALTAERHFVSRIPLGPALGQCCGGAVTLVTEVFDSLPAALGEHGDAFVRRIEGDTPRPLSIERAAAQLRNGSDRGLQFTEGWLSEPLETTRAPLFVWGAGHVGRAAVATLAPTEAFDITWIDSGPERFPTGEACIPLPHVDELPAVNIPDATPLAPAHAHHLILTYSHAIDLDLCHRLLSRGFASAGLIGSETKWARFRSKLRALGHTDAQISRIRCPIGQPALGKHPQAIAVGAASELLMTLQTGAQSGTLGKDVAV